jgi:hypothetical protein
LIPLLQNLVLKRALMALAGSPLVVIHVEILVS